MMSHEEARGRGLGAFRGFMIWAPGLAAAWAAAIWWLA